MAHMTLAHLDAVPSALGRAAIRSLTGCLDIWCRPSNAMT